MEVTIAVVADAANISRDDKLNLLGVFREIRSPGFPAQHPFMQMVLRFNAGADEFGEQRTLVIVLIDEDGSELGRREGRLRIPPADAGEHAVWDLIVPFANLSFPAAGRYAFRIMLNGD